MSTAGEALTAWLRSMPSLQDVEWQLKKAEAIRRWAIRGISYGVGDRVEIIREQNTANGWAPYRECLAVGATGVVTEIDFNPYWHDGEGGWYASIRLDREWSTSSGGYGPFWHGKAEDTPEGMKPPSKYDQENHPEGRHHTFSIAVGDLAFPVLTGGSTPETIKAPTDNDQSRVPSCADLAAPICGNCEDCQPIRGDQELPS